MSNERRRRSTHADSRKAAARHALPNQQLTGPASNNAFALHPLDRVSHQFRSTFESEFQF